MSREERLRSAKRNAYEVFQLIQKWKESDQRIACMAQHMIDVLSFLATEETALVAKEQETITN